MTRILVTGATGVLGRRVVPLLVEAGHEVPNITLPIGTEVELMAEGDTPWIVYREDALTMAEVPEEAPALAN